MIRRITAPRPAREVAITARQIATDDPANYDSGTPSPAPDNSPDRRRGIFGALASAATATLACLVLDRPTLAALPALLALSVTARAAWRRRHGTTRRQPSPD